MYSTIRPQRESPTAEGRVPRRGGFTIIELAVVVTVLGILAGIAAPNFQRALDRGRAAELVEKLYFIEQVVTESSLSVEGAAMPKIAAQIATTTTPGATSLGRLYGFVSFGSEADFVAALAAAELSELVPSHFDLGWASIFLQARATMGNAYVPSSVSVKVLIIPVEAVYGGAGKQHRDVARRVLPLAAEALGGRLAMNASGSATFIISETPISGTTVNP